MDYLEDLNGCRVVGEGVQDTGAECIGCDEEEKPLSFTDHKRTVDHVDPGIDSCSFKNTEGSTGRERIRIIFKRKAVGEDHAVNVVVQSPPKKQTVSSSSKDFTDPLSDPSGPIFYRDCLHDADTVLVKRDLLPKTPSLESECRAFGVGIAMQPNEDTYYGIDTLSGHELGRPSELVGSCIACHAEVSSTAAGQDSYTQPASNECFAEDGASVGGDALTQGNALNPGLLIRPKARRTPLAFPSSGVHAVDGEGQVTIRSSLSGSPIETSIPPPAKRSPLPLPVVRSPLRLLTQNQVSSAESSVDVSVLTPVLPDESMGNLDTFSTLQGALQGLSSTHSTSTLVEFASTVSGVGKIETEIDVQSMSRDPSRWSSHTCATDASKQDFNSLQSAGDSENFSGLDDDLKKANQSHGEVNLPPEPSLQYIAPVPHRFSFQRLINGDLSDLEDDDEEADDEYEDCMEGDEEEDAYADENEDEDEDEDENEDEDKDEDVVDDGRVDKDDKKTEEVKEEEEDDEDQEDSEIYSAESWPLEQSRDLDIDVSKSESQQSDDMYHGHEGISFESLRGRRDISCVHSKHSPSERGCKGDLAVDTAAHAGCLIPTSDGSASSTRPQIPHGKPCMPTDAGQKTSSDSSRDLQIVPTPSPRPAVIKLKIKMPTESNLKEVPGSSKALLSSGLLEGCRVRYQDRGGVKLTGVIQNGGILCNCRNCKGGIVVNVSSFEKHAGSSARHPSDNIFLENGKSLNDILKAGWHASEGKFEEALCKAISSTEDESEKSSIRSGSGSVVAHSRKEHSTIAESSRMGSRHLRRSDPASSSHHHRRSDPASSSHHHHRSDPTSSSRRSDPASKNVQTLQLSQTRDMNLHKTLFLPGGIPDGTEVAYYIKGQRILTGVKKGHGICCGCCNEVVSCSLFEAHAGWGSRRNPYTSIYLSDGQSLHEAALALGAQKLEEVPIHNSRDNEDFCAECGDGGDLVLCDGCPRAYHTECAGLSSIPAGDWFCPYCQNKSGHEKRQPDKKSTRGSGRILNTLTKENPLERCQRVVKASKNAIGGCVICKNGDFLKSGFGAKTIMLCDQCEREYHVGCMKEKGVADLQELPAGEWFCSADCKRIHNILEALVLSGPEPVDSSICSWVLEKQHQKAPAREKHHNWEFTWQLLHGRRGNPENGKILSEAATIFTESFDPIVDATSGRDLISLMVYSRSIRDQDFRGMYCAVLKWNETVVSAAIIRVFGRQFAEMPLVATSSASRGQGFFQLLMSSVEQLLGVLQVECLILPAAEGAEDIWTNKFGFSKLEDGQLQRFGSEVQVMIFQGSSMLLKAIPLQKTPRWFSNK